MLRFSLFGFPVAIQWLFWVNTALFGGGLGASTAQEIRSVIIWVLAAFVSIIIHELGHTFLMRRYGARASIMLYAFGGLAIPDRRFTRVQDIIVSLAGPVVQIAAGLAVIVGVRYLSPDIITIRELLSDFVIISIYWGIFNLVPIYPLDGGHILNGVLGPRLFKVTCIVGIVCALALALWAVSTERIFGTLMFGMLAYENYQRMRGITPSSLLFPR